MGKENKNRKRLKKLKEKLNKPLLLLRMNLNSGVCRFLKLPQGLLSEGVNVKVISEKFSGQK
ncbi:hypothetical protein ACIQAA_30920 [Neobacillus sp. NPDC093182]|uniref:hypothetical protein n=1 Tax=Neobacillus sp. NPDC093182 TaxID=3364297 RepID=UPI00380E78EB